MIHKDFWGRYTSSSSGTEAKVYAKSVELRYIDTGRTVHYTVTKFKKRSPIRSEAVLEPSKNIDFIVFKPLGQEEEQTAIEWPNPRVGKLVMVEKYTDTDNNTTLIIFVLVVILFLILFNK